MFWIKDEFKVSIMIADRHSKRMQLFRTLNQWEPYFSATIWSRLGLTVGSDTHNLFFLIVCFMRLPWFISVQKTNFKKIFLFSKTIYSSYADWQQMPRGTVPGREPVVANL